MSKSATAIRHQELVSLVGKRRPWRCSDRLAIYCPIHHDCTCPGGRNSWFDLSASCPLHGTDTTHPFDVELVR